MFAYGLEPKDMADQFKTTTQSISRWLHAVRTPTKPAIAGIASKMDISEEDLMEKDLTLYFIYRSGMVKSDVVMEPEGGYSLVSRSRVINHLQYVKRQLEDLMENNDKAIVDLG